MRSPLKVAVFEDGRPQWRIGREAGLSRTVISHLVNGVRAATPEERSALARVLARPEQELFPALESRAA